MIHEEIVEKWLQFYTFLAIINTNDNSLCAHALHKGK